MRFQFQPGDVIFFRSTLVEHYVVPFVGNRTSLVFFTHHNELNSFSCGWMECGGVA